MAFASNCFEAFEEHQQPCTTQVDSCLSGLLSQFALAREEARLQMN
jgi:hypothetical protein